MGDDKNGDGARDLYVHDEWEKTSAFCFLRVSLALVKTGAYNMDH
jgi:hypothetical protein